MRPSLADHDDALRAYAAIRSALSAMAMDTRIGTSKEVVARDLVALDIVAFAFVSDEQVTRAEYGEFLRALVRWLIRAKGMVRI